MCVCVCVFCVCVCVYVCTCNLWCCVCMCSCIMCVLYQERIQLIWYSIMYEQYGINLQCPMFIEHKTFLICYPQYSSNHPHPHPHHLLYTHTLQPKLSSSQSDTFPCNKKSKITQCSMQILFKFLISSFIFVLVMSCFICTLLYSHWEEVN